MASKQSTLQSFFGQRTIASEATGDAGAQRPIAIESSTTEQSKPKSPKQQSPSLDEKTEKISKKTVQHDTDSDSDDIRAPKRQIIRRKLPGADSTEATVKSSSNVSASDQAQTASNVTQSPARKGSSVQTTLTGEKLPAEEDNTPSNGSDLDVTVHGHVLGDYHPVDSVADIWEPTKPMPYKVITSVFRAIEATTKRLEIQQLLCNMFRSIIAISPGDLLPAVYLSVNKLAPAYEAVELGLGDAMVTKAIAEATGRQLRDVKAAFVKEGDLGIVAESSRSRQSTLGFASKPKVLTVRAVYDSFRAIAEESGARMQESKVRMIKSLLVQADGAYAEPRYIVRGLQGKLRIGLAEKTVLIALAHAFTITPPAPGADKLCTVASYTTKSKDNMTNDKKITDRSNVTETNTAITPTGVNNTWALVFDTRVDSKGHAVPSKTTSERLEDTVSRLRQIFSEMPSYNEIVPALLAGGIEEAEKRCTLVPGVPVAPMLAKPTKGISEVLDRFEGHAFTCEWKYDGERAQVHKFQKDVNGAKSQEFRIFSRNSEDTTGKYPDIASMLPSAEAPGGIGAGPRIGGGVMHVVNETADAPLEETEKEQSDISPSATDAEKHFGMDLNLGIEIETQDTVESYILDGEVVAYDRERHMLLPFQKLATRARKDVTEENVKVQVVYAAFDLLYFNGQSLLKKPFAERRAILQRHFKEVPGKFAFANGADYDGKDVNDIEAYLNEAVQGNCEGLMVKTLLQDASYEPAKRSLNWLKLKKDYMAGLTDSLDLVPVAAWHGKGKRTGTYGAYLLACYDPDEEEYQSLTRVGTGFSDEQLKELTELFTQKDLVREVKPKNVRVGDGLATPDVWFEPSIVWEVRAADLSISPVHVAAAGKVDPVKGIALRFPRFLRVRDDKDADDASNSDQVVQMYYDQPQINNGAGKQSPDDNDDLL